MVEPAVAMKREEQPPSAEGRNAADQDAAGNEPDAEPAAAAGEKREAYFLKQIAENEILRKAAQLRETIAMASMQAENDANDPRKRRKAHWDFLLIEMRWMAQDFAAERTWKTAAAKTFGSRAAAVDASQLRHAAVAVKEAVKKGRAEKGREKGREKGEKGEKGDRTEQRDAAQARAAREALASEDGESSESTMLLYGALDGVAELFDQLESAQQLAQSGFQQQLLAWEDTERRRQRAVAELARQQREEEDYRGGRGGDDYDGMWDDDGKGKRKKLKKGYGMLPVLREDLGGRPLLAPQQQHAGMVPSAKRLRTSVTASHAARAAAAGGVGRPPHMHAAGPQLMGLHQDGDPRWTTRKKKRAEEEDAPYRLGDLDEGVGKRDRMGARDARRVYAREDARRGGDRGGAAAAATKGRGVPVQQALGPPWSANEELLLQTVVREFCPLKQNWALVSDVLSAGALLRGVFRRADACRVKWEQLGPSLEAPDDDDVSRSRRRQLLAKLLPADEDTLKLHLERLCTAASRLRQRRQQEAQAAAAVTSRGDCHSSWATARALGALADPLLIAAAHAEERKGSLAAAAAPPAAAIPAAATAPPAAPPAAAEVAPAGGGASAAE